MAGAVLCLALMLITGCSEDKPEGPALPGETAVEGSVSQNQAVEEPNILLITLDTVRADHLGCYLPRERGSLTPVMDGLAVRGTRFARAVAPAPITLPSHASILTGQYPVRHGVRDNSVYYLSDEATTLAEHLAHRGYRTGAAVASIVLSHRFGVHQGFEVFEEGNLIVEDSQILENGQVERGGAEITEEALRFMEASKDRDNPFFFWAHYYDPHEPYLWHPNIDQHPAATPYEAEIRYVDVQVERLLKALEQNGLADSTVVVLVSDHGEGLGQHYERSHILLTYESTLSVAMIFAGPMIEEGRVVDKGLGRLVDVMPTLLDMLDVEIPADLDGISLWPLMEAGSEPAPGPEIAYFETMGPLTYDWAPLDGVTTPEWKYIRGPVEELYHLPTDPFELTDRVGDKPEIVAELRKAANVFQNLPPSTGGVYEMDGRQSDLFGALGYTTLDVRVRKVSEDAPHPKDMVGVANLYDKALLLYRSREFKAALRDIKKCVELSPDTAFFYDILGRCKLGLGDTEGSVEAFRQALAIHPRMTDTRLTLGIILVQAGALDEAEIEFKEVVRTAPTLDKGYGFLASLYNQQKRPEDELQILEALFEKVPPEKIDNIQAMRIQVSTLRSALGKQ